MRGERDVGVADLGAIGALDRVGGGDCLLAPAGNIDDNVATIFRAHLADRRIVGAGIGVGGLVMATPLVHEINLERTSGT